MTLSTSEAFTSTEDNGEPAALFDPFEAHFVSENKRNAFVKALEDNREYTYEDIASTRT